MVATIVSLDGIPGAGKSYLLSELEKRLTLRRTSQSSFTTSAKVICLQEPVEEWSKLKDSNGRTLFSLYYNNQKRYALAFQLQVLHTRFELMERTITENPDALIITERDITTDYKIFTQMLYDKGMFEEIEFKLYQQLFESYDKRLKILLCSDTKKTSYKRIYLTTCADVSYERMKKRGRKEEKDVSLDYLRLVEKYHKETFNSLSNIMLIDGDWDTRREETFHEILSFL